MMMNQSFIPKPLPQNLSEVYAHVRTHLMKSIGNPDQLPANVSENSAMLVEGYIALISKLLEGNHEEEEEVIFDSYLLCLNYMHSLYRKLGKVTDSTLLNHRFNLISLCERGKQYKNASKQGYVLLAHIKLFLGQSLESEGEKAVPRPGEDVGRAKQVVSLVIGVVCSLLSCNLNLDGSRSAKTYKDFHSFVNDIKPWIRLIETEEDRIKINNDLATLINGTALLLIARLKLEVVGLHDVTLLFCKQTIEHYAKSSLKDQMYKIGLDMCNLCFTKCVLKFEHTKAIMGVVLHAIANECKVNQKNCEDFIRLVDSCANQLHNVTDNAQKKDVASIFKSLAGKDFFSKGVRLVMQLYAAGFVLSDITLYNSWNKSSFDVQELLIILNDLLTGLKSIDIDQEQARGAKELVCVQLCMMIMSEHKTITDRLEEDLVNLSAVEELLYSALKGREGDHKNNMKHVADLVGACFILSAITKESTKSIEAFKKLTTDGQSQADVWKYFSPCLPDVSLRFHKAKRTREATESLTLFCKNAWNRVLQFCKRLSSRNKNGEDFFDETIVGFVRDACHVTSSMFSVIEDTEMDQMATFVIRIWSEAEAYFPILISELQGFNDNKMLKENITERLEGKMERTLQRSKSLIESGIQLRVCGSKGLIDCIKYITDAINMMMSIEKGEGDLHLLAKAYGLLALCTREANPKSKDFINHLHMALTLWSSEKCSRGRKTYEEEDFQVQDLMLMFYIADLLLLEGDMQRHSTITKIIIEILVSKGYSWGQCFDIFWSSRQVGHALCISTINDAFVKTLEEQNESLDIVYLKECINSKAMKVGFQLSLGVVSTFSSLDSCNADDDIHPQMTAKEVEDLVSSLHKDDSFLAAQLYYDLGERYIAKGFLSEALTYAKQSHDWRMEHRKSCFTIQMSQGKFVVDSKVAIPASSYNSETSNLECIRTPWHVMRCALESFLQVGRIYNLLGDRRNAASYLKNGQLLSSMLNLSLFQANFSCELGKLYRKQHEWDDAKKELKSARSKLDVVLGSNISCLKCKLLLEASINQEQGDLSFDIFKSNNQSDVSVLNNAKDFYRVAEEKLKDFEWENDVSSPKVASEKITTFCDTIDMPTDVATRGCARSCWHCQFSEVPNSSSLRRSIELKWECTRRRLFLRVLIGRGNCCEVLEEIENESKILLYSVSVLVSRSTFQNSHFKISSKCLTTLINHNWMGAGIEPATVLYQLCCFYLKCIAVKDTRDIISMTTIVLGLKLSFILSREVPMLFKKVSQLLAALYTLLPPNNDSILTSTLKVSTDSLGSYFHQACIGTHFNHMFVSRARKLKAATVDGSCTFNSTSRCLGLLPQGVKELESFILDFFKDLPRITIVCMSFLEDGFEKLLGELLPYAYTNTWIMLSRLNSDDIPVSIILPIGRRTENNFFVYPTPPEGSNTWVCPCLGSKVYRLLPEFESILKGDHDIIKAGGAVRGNGDRERLDKQLCTFLRAIEEAWFGIWKNMLLGERSDDTELNLKVKELKTVLKAQFGLDIEECILKVVIECGCDNFGSLECLVEAFLTKKCYPESTVTSVDEVIQAICQQINDAYQQTGAECSRKPVILVMDYDIQVLPLESLPILRNKDVYRMPSVASIVSTLYRRSCQTDGVVMHDTIFPSINPINAYYMLNVSGDLEVGVCKSLFEKFQIEGVVMTKPSEAELKLALETHDLFIYVSHGHGLQYIPVRIFQEIDKCAVTLLMGCSSGALEVRGSLAPEGAPLYYLLGGSPALCGNLWAVTDIEIAHFTKELFQGLINATKSQRHAQSLDEAESDKGEQPSKKRKFVVDPVTLVDQVTLGSVLYKSRVSSSEEYLPYLSGAALVCYGVPTLLKKTDVCNTTN